MSKQKDRFLYINASCKVNADENWICASKRPDISGCEDEDIEKAIESFERELKKFLDEEYKISGELTLIDRSNKAKNGDIQSDSGGCVILSVELEDLKVSLKYRIGSPVNRSLTEFEQKGAEA